jgi:copper oxidase (laccase) domain-containing protein
MDLYDKFLAFNADSKQFFHRNRDKKLFFNLPGFVKYQLKLLGIKRISDNHVTTYNSNKYFSVRFAKHQGFEEKRRNLSCITIKEENELLHRDLL